MTRRHTSQSTEPGPKHRATSLADVALLAGVTPATVSRALRKPEMISETTRMRVLDAVERLGYVTNGAARALVSHRTMTIGALVPRFGSSSFPTMIQALEATLAQSGYTLLLSAPERKRLHEIENLRILLGRGVDAVALLGTEHPPELFTMLASRHIPFVMMWAPPNTHPASVGFSEHAAAESAIKHLKELGHRYIGFISGRTDNNDRARRRSLGVTSAIAKYGMTLCEDAHIETEYGFREGAEAAREIVRRASAATAIVCGNDYLAAGALSALASAGVAVPGQMSVIGFNDNDFSPYLQPPLTTVKLPIYEIGEQAGHYLLAQLSGETPKNPVALPSKLMPRQSTGRPRNTAAGNKPRGSKT